MNKKILIFGAFNPITNAHIHMGIRASRLYPNHEIVYVPSSDNYISYWKKYNSTNILPSDIRIDLIKGAIKNHDNFKISKVETSMLSDGSTYDSVRLIKNYDITIDNGGIDMHKLSTPNEVIICIGDDKLDELVYWNHYEDLIRENKFLVFTRYKNHLDLPSCLSRFHHNFYYVDCFNDSTISSTKVRNLYHGGLIDKIKDLVPENVYQYFLDVYGNDDIFKKGE